METIILDESGNTGSDILNTDQPLLVLSSVRVTEDNLKEAEEHFHSINAAEWKFSKFKNSGRQMRLIQSFLEKDWVNGSSIRVHITDKKFFAVTKIVDLICEPVARAGGVNLYEQGGAVSLANLKSMVLPVWLGEDGFNKLLHSFVVMIREGSDANYKIFKDAVIEAHAKVAEHNDDHDEFNMLSGLLFGSLYPELWRNYLSEYTLDPLVPAYFSLIDFWGQELKSDFAVFSDESKALASQLKTIQKLSNPSIKPKILPAVGDGWSSLPYRSTSIAGGSSKDNRAVQIADLVAGTANYIFSPIANSLPSNNWQTACREIFFEKNLIQNVLWPSREVTPEGVGALHVRGELPLDYTVQILATDDPE
ncbi:MAG: DUF3800 domain-containing protein [Pseudomonadota bacterium]|jgi:hypothetical protein